MKPRRVKSTKVLDQFAAMAIHHAFIAGARWAGIHISQDIEVIGAANEHLKAVSRMKIDRHPVARLERYRELVARDGEVCWYCGKRIRPETATLEHLVPLCNGGPDHAKNLVLVHKHCNQEAGKLSVAEKVRLRERNHVSKSVRWTVHRNVQGTVRGLSKREGK